MIEKMNANTNVGGGHASFIERDNHKKGSLNEKRVISISSTKRYLKSVSISQTTKSINQFLISPLTLIEKDLKMISESREPDYLKSLQNEVGKYLMDENNIMKLNFSILDSEKQKVILNRLLEIKTEKLMNILLNLPTNISEKMDILNVFFLKPSSHDNAIRIIAESNLERLDMKFNLSNSQYHFFLNTLMFDIFSKLDQQLTLYEEQFLHVCSPEERLIVLQREQERKLDLLIVKKKLTINI